MIGEQYGHPYFYELTKAENDLHSRKNHDYAGGGHPLGNFQRVAHILESYPGLKLGDPFTNCMVQMIKQLDAALWLRSQGHAAIVEGIPERLFDIGVYAKIAQCILHDERDPSPGG